jgi:hypothetical protein
MLTQSRIPQSKDEKWLALILLGLIGMFLSEFLIWNHALQIIKQHIAVPAMPRIVLVASFIYIFLFVIGADIIQRYKINDKIGILLLGSIYGLIIEGVWGNMIFDPVGFGPRIFGIWLIHLSFTALSWHPLIDFAVGFFFLKILLRGNTGLGENAVTNKEMVFLAIFSLFWFIWPYARWFRVAGIPLSIQAITFLYPMVLFGILFYLVFKRKTGYVPEKILSAKAYLFLIAFILYFAVKKFVVVQDKSPFLFFCFIVILYVAIFVLYIKFARKKYPGRSIFEEGFPVTGAFSIAKYLKVWGFIIVFYTVFKLLAVLPMFRILWLLLTTVITIGFVAFSAWLPLFTVIRIITSLFSNKGGLCTKK